MVAVLRREVGREERHVGAALPQRRDVHRDHVEAVEQVFAELALLDLRLEVLVRRGEDADVHRDRVRAADPLDLPRLEHAQQLDLQVRPHRADFVEEQRPAVGQLEAPRLVAVRAGEGAAHVAEELALDQVLGDRAAVDRDQLPVLARRVAVVQRLDDQLLADAALAGDQDRAVYLADLLEQLEDPLHRRALADDPVEAGPLEQLGPQPRVLLAQRLGVHAPLEGEPQLGHRERLGQVVRRPFAHRLDRVVDRGEAGHDQDDQVGVVRLGLAHQLEAAHSRQLEVGDQDVGRFLDQHFPGPFGRRGAAHRVADARQILDDGPQKARVVLGNDNIPTLWVVRHVVHPPSAPKWGAAALCLKTIHGLFWKSVKNSTVRKKIPVRTVGIPAERQQLPPRGRDAKSPPFRAVGRLGASPRKLGT